jgi:hypothetical protein
MRKVVISEFVSLDGVVGSPQRWHLPYFDEEMGREIQAAMEDADAMLVGRVPTRSGPPSSLRRAPKTSPPPTHERNTPKFVVSRILEGPWSGTTPPYSKVASPRGSASSRGGRAKTSRSPGAQPWGGRCWPRTSWTS